MRLDEVFETMPCKRCGGSGRHSYNQIHGDLCYGCNGRGVQFTKKDAPLVEDFVNAKKKATRTVLKNIRPGEIIGNVWAPVTNTEGKTINPWRKVISIEQTDEVCCWSTVNGTRTSTGYFHIITLEDGTQRRENSNTLVTRKITNEDILALCQPATAARVRAALQGRTE